MKIKPIENVSKETYNNTRYNDNAVGFVNTITPGSLNNPKMDYSAIVLTSIMHELGYLKHTMVKSSFDEAQSFINKIEGEES